MRSPVDLILEDEEWLTDLPDLAEVAATGARMALELFDIAPGNVEIAVLACGDQKIKALNGSFRDKPHATNVLSWPALDLSARRSGEVPDPPPDIAAGTVLSLGDVAIARQTCVQEAESGGIPLKTHVTHLILHSVLHLLGYDHQTEQDAELMEGLESRAMLAAGLPNPYRVPRDGPA